MPSRDELLGEISREESRLGDLQTQLEAARARLVRLRERLASVFVNGTFEPWPDQWAFLAGVERIDPAFVHALADDASRRGQVIGVRMSDAVDEDERTPWRRPPSGRPRKAVITEPLPHEVRAVLSQRLFIEKAGLPSALLNQLKRLAAFQNPEF
jgi:hypothetical protein